MSSDSSNSESSPSKTELINFIETARNRGFSDELIYKVLSSRGWSSNQVTSAYLEVLERVSALPVPAPRSRSNESARDAFLYLLSFATLAIWSQALGSIGFIFVNRLIPDPLTRNYDVINYELASSLARLIIVFPLYLFLMRLLSKDLAVNPDKYASGIRKWLTYLALFIAALIVIVDLIIFLTSLLRGELTLRFTAKVIIVLVLAGEFLVLFDLVAATTCKIMKQANFDKIFVILATIGVVIGVVAGFWLLGSPFKQRQLRADQQRLQDLYKIAFEFYEQASNNDIVNPSFKLPESLPETESITDPITAKPYNYQRLNDTEYKLCAEFATDSNERVLNEQSQEQKFWQHPAGIHCFQFNVLKKVSYPDYFYY